MLNKKPSAKTKVQCYGKIDRICEVIRKELYELIDDEGIRDFSELNIYITSSQIEFIMEGCDGVISGDSDIEFNWIVSLPE